MTDQATAKRNILVLTAAQALGAASPPIIISLGGIVGQTLSSVPALATLAAASLAAFASERLLALVSRFRDPPPADTGS
mgnify:CR=1 FL=1